MHPMQTDMYYASYGEIFANEFIATNIYTIQWKPRIVQKLDAPSSKQLQMVKMPILVSLASSSLGECH